MFGMGPRLIAGSTAASGGDPFWGSVSNLLHFDGTSGSNTFTDEKGVTWTATGGAVLTNAQSKFGGTSGDFTPSGVINISQASNPLTNTTFTVEGFFYPTANSLTGIHAIMRNALCGIYINGGTMYWYDNTSYLFGTGALTAGQWYHFAGVCNAGTMRMALNGNFSAASAVPGPVTTAGAFYLGGDTFGQGLRGYLDEVRVTPGVARYTSNFTPPSAPFPNHT